MGVTNGSGSTWLVLRQITYSVVPEDAGTFPKGLLAPAAVLVTSPFPVSALPPTSPGDVTDLWHCNGEIGQVIEELL